jgi:hypothetical protein
MKAADIAKALGAAQRSRAWWRCLCPVHGSRTGHSATLALRDGEHGLIAICHAGCSRTDIFAELRQRGLIGGSVNRQHQVSSPRLITANLPDDDRRIAIARRIWDRSQDARGTPAAAYFFARGLDVDRPRCLRYAASLRRPDGAYGPAVVARVDDVEGRLVGVHRTWLVQDDAGIWRRRDRAAFGLIRGGAVRLARAAETLMVGEGIETCAAAMQSTGMPGWAALSTSGIVSLILPPLVRHVIILADNDASGAGERAARRAAQRWLAEGRRVQIAMPPEAGTDMADVHAQRAPIPEVGHVAA